MAHLPLSLTDAELLPGQYLSPHLLHGSFEAPCYMLGLAGDEDLMMGQRIDRIADSGGGRPGDYISSFCHRFLRRSLMAIRPPASEGTRIAFPAVSGRFILVVLRMMGAPLRHEMEARGNAISPEDD